MPSEPHTASPNPAPEHHVLAAALLAGGPGERRIFVRTEHGAAVLLLSASLAAQIGRDLLPEGRGQRAEIGGQKSEVGGLTSVCCPLSSGRPASAVRTPQSAIAPLLAAPRVTAAGAPDRRCSPHLAHYHAILRALALDPAASASALCRARGLRPQSFYAWRSEQLRHAKPVFKPGGALL